MVKVIVAALAAFAAGQGLAAARPEISWSVMHPTAISVDEMRRVLEKAAEYGGVDSIEICGDCASPEGGINGLLDYAPYPKAHAACDKKAVADYTAKLNEIVRLSHEAGKPVYLWHREGHMPEGIVEDLPKLMDEDGEFDLLGESYLTFLRWKLQEAFRRAPELDGIVLTLTEAKFSVIHNSRPERYPPIKVTEKIADICLEEHERLGKRFIFRSFGSVAADYETLIAGAAAAAHGHRFEIETKATAYDFDPFLPPNQFLRKIPGCTLGAECDGLGEYLGAGYLPAAQVPVVRRYVNEGTEKRVDRYTIRIDRVGNSIFDSAQEVNLYAYMRFIRDASATPEKVMDEWAAKRWPKCGAEMKRLAAMGFDMVAKTQFIDRNVVFHQNPVSPSFKYIKACGICSVFRNDADLHMTKDQWGMLSDRRTPGRRAIRAEKDEAVMLADEGLALLESVKDRLEPAEYARHLRAWTIATKATRAIRAFVRCACAYFDDMEEGDVGATTLKAAIAEADRTITGMMNDPNASEKGFDLVHARAMGENLDRVYFVPLRWLCREFANEYAAEFKARAAMKGREDVLDFVIPGGIYDDNRVDRIMHASYQDIGSGVPVRIVGNPVFPNATMSVEFRDMPGTRVEIDCDRSYADEWNVVETRAGGILRVTVSKKGARYPGVRSVALVRRSR